MASSSNPYEHYNNPSVEDDLIDPDDATLDDLDDPLATNARTPLTGNIQSQPSTSSRANNLTSSNYLSSALPLPGTNRTTLNTIDESVWATLHRDISAVWTKLREVLYPKYLLGGSMSSSSSPNAPSNPSLLSFSAVRGAYEGLRQGGLSGARDGLRDIAGRALDAEGLIGENNMSPGLRDWDLWGPLVFCLCLSGLLSWRAREDQGSKVFSGVFALVWIGEAVVTVQIKLLGGNISFAQSICIIGYTLFPLVIAALLSALRLPLIPRIPIYLVLVAWSLAAGVSILGGSGVVKNRVGIAVYPLFVFYIALGVLCFIS